MKSMRIEQVDIAGRKLRVGIKKGDPSKTPLLVFNGIGANIELIEPFVSALDGITVITFDVPGVGGSPTPAFPYRLGGLAALSVRVLDYYGISEVDVLGVSWGGALAQQFAYSNSAYTRRLILCATSMGMVMVPGTPKALLKMANPRRYYQPSYMLDNAGDIYGGKVSDPNHEVLRAHTGRLKAPGGLGYYWQMLSGLGWTSAHWLHRIKHPALVMAGSQDNIVPEINGRMLACLLPNADLRIYECGHMFILTCLDEVVADIEQFLGGDGSD